MNMKASAVANCPDCGEDVRLQGNIELGMKVTCPNCGANLEVVETIPVELDRVYQDEDYEYYDEEDE